MTTPARPILQAAKPAPWERCANPTTPGTPKQLKSAESPPRPDWRNESAFRTSASIGRWTPASTGRQLGSLRIDACASKMKGSCTFGLDGVDSKCRSSS